MDDITASAMRADSDMHMVTSMHLRVMTTGAEIRKADSEKAVEEVVSGIDWSAVEDAVNDQLPDGFYCKLDG